ncbi:hypothetical protein PT273_01970 [Orbaceae bacterium ESL0727]|nr:hypothetical protein [Orbaceae bacterium ESL0727]
MSNVTYEAEPASSGLHLDITGSGNVAKVTLTGPRNGATPAEAATTVPTTFTLYATVNGTRTKIYSFKLNKWFIVSPDITNEYGTAISYNANYCSRYCAGYRLPHIADLTNGNGYCATMGSGSKWTWTGSLGSNGTWYYTRQIGGGLFAEWGNMMIREVEGPDYYPNTDFSKVRLLNYGVWVDDRLCFTPYYTNVGISVGKVGLSNVAISNFQGNICVTP